MEMNNNSKIQNPNSKILRILLIEDNPGDARLIKEMLKESGVQFEIESADRLSAGIGQVKLDGFDVILLDLGLPDSQGLGTLRKLNEIRPKAPVIVLTGLADEAVGTQAVKEGAQDYLIKGQTDHYLLSRSIRYAIERKRAEDLIVVSEQKYRVLVETMNEGLGVQDRNGIITYMNKRACEMFGYEPEELIGRPIDILFDEEGLKNFRAQMAQRQHGKEENYEITWKRKDGAPVHTLVAPHVIYDTEGKFDGSFGVFVDITDRKRAEEALLESKQKLELAMRAANMGSWHYHLKTGQFEADEVGKVMHGIEADETIMTLEQGNTYIHPDDIPEIQRRFEQAVKSNGTYENEYRVILPDNRIRWIYSFGRVAKDTSYLIGIVQDITDRKKAESELRESEEKFKAIFESATDGILLVNMETMKFYMGNKKIFQMLGYTEDEIINLGITDIHPKADLPHVMEQFKRQARREIEVAINIPVKRKDGSIFYADINSFPITLTGTKYLIGIFRDITERKQSEEALRASEAFIKAVLDNLPIGIAVNSVDPAVKFDYMNDNFFKYYRTTREALAVPDAFWEAVYEDPKFREEIKKRVLDDCKSGDPARMHWEDVTITRQGRETTFITARNIPLPDKQLMISTVWDVTERKKAEGNLKKSEAFIKNILESVGEGFIVIDPEYKIISANKAYCEMQKASLGNIIGRPCYEVSHRTNKPCFMDGEECAPKLTFKTGEPHLAVHTHYDKEDNPIYIETRSYPMKDDEGKVFAVIEILNNVTEKRTLENQLRHAQKMEAIGQLAGGIAHDFNNMLNVIIGYASLMQMNMSHEDPKLEQVKEILNAGDRAAHLTKGLLTFSRKQVMEVRRVNLNEIIEGFKKMLARIIGEDIELRINLHPPVSPLIKGGSEGGLTLKADIVQIEQVLLNLASNAKDAMPKGGILTIETMPVSIDSAFIRIHGYGEPGMHALITVSDTGEGMDDRTREKIFEPFFTTKEFGKGTGLGLSIVYGIIKQHNGYINCYSEPGKGTTFKIYLPLIKPEEAEKVEIAETELPKGGTETILVAEDDASVRDLTKQILEGFGYTVIEAVDGIDAVNKFKENKDNVHLLLFDLIMPNKNGKDAYEDIQGIRHDIKVIFTSGYAADIIQRFGIEYGIDFISKPVSPHELLRKVRDMLG